ncbi:hypothetical protein [Actinopolymorpha pittospori]|uniref:IrrE N-terminal-like domain-containing protein n=1 Tax=Actinopolymorpha pittospori TaxID=648752 RepID=A0A927R5U7_9ACTN|nr:hypothetical protein [Actinopolymorpha pittospori]MBE1603707.1 hypothetical protein [Actinopolymorpha pittospori]
MDHDELQIGVKLKPKFVAECLTRLKVHLQPYSIPLLIVRTNKVRPLLDAIVVTNNEVLAIRRLDVLTRGPRVLIPRNEILGVDIKPHFSRPALVIHTTSGDKDLGDLNEADAHVVVTEIRKLASRRLARNMRDASTRQLPLRKSEENTHGAAPTPPFNITNGLFSEAGSLLGTVNSQLRFIAELLGDLVSDDTSAPLSGLSARLEREFEWLGLLQEQGKTLSITGWLDELRRIITSEHLITQPRPDGEIELVGVPFWPLNPNATAGPTTLTLGQLQSIHAQVRELKKDLKDAASRITEAHATVEAPLEVPPPSCGLGGGSKNEDLPAGSLALPFGESEDPPSPTVDTVRQAMDELVREGLHYRSTAAYKELVRFVSGFRQYSPFNAMLVHMQMPRARYVATATDWGNKYGRTLRPGARPLIMLRPGGPTMPVYDVSETVAGPNSKVPEELVEPFKSTVNGADLSLWDRFIDNAKLWGIRVTPARMGSSLAGFVRPPVYGEQTQQVSRRIVLENKRREVTLQVPVEFEIEVRESQDIASRLVTILHECAHVLCGHLGRGHSHTKWPDRSRGSKEVDEFEAETTAFVACRRVDPAAVFPPYLDGYLGNRSEVPDVSLETMLTAALTLQDWLEKTEPVPKHVRALLSQQVSTSQS